VACCVREDERHIEPVPSLSFVPLAAEPPDWDREGGDHGRIAFVAPERIQVVEEGKGARERCDAVRDSRNNPIVRDVIRHVTWGVFLDCRSSGYGEQ